MARLGIFALLATTVTDLAAKNASEAPETLAEAQVERMVDERLTNLPTLQARIHLLQELAQTNRNRPEVIARQLEYWEQFGRTVLQTGTEAEFQQYQKARMETLTVDGQMSPSLVNEALRLLHAEQRWEELQRFEKQLYQPLASPLPVNAKQKHSKKQPSARPVVGSPQLFAWMYERTLGRAGMNPAFTVDIRQPLIVPVSRAASGLFQQIHAALEDKQYKEVARLLTNSYPLRNEGLITTPGDEQLFVSYRSMQLILLRRRELAEAINGRLDDAARLGIQQTMSQGDPAAIETLTIQYYGTPAHASACQWLGDRELAGADFTQALSWYEEGRLSASPEQQPDLAARVRLAAAMLGNPRGAPPTQPVSFGEGRLSPEQFERRIRDAIARQRANAETASPLDEFPVFPAPQPVQFRFASWGEFDEGRYRDLLSGNLAATAQDDLVIFSNRKQAVAIESASGKTRWSWELGKSLLPSPIRPLVQGRNIYFRAITAPGRYGIVCLDKKTGRGLWRRDCGDDLTGDPQLVRGRLYVLTFGTPTGSGSMFSSPVNLLELNPESGEVLSRRHIAESVRVANRRVAADTDKPPEYQSIGVGNRLVVLFSGAVLCFDLQGRVQWLRNSAAIPEDIDPISHSRLCQSPLEFGGRLYLQQPGSCAVECLDTQTGQVVWRRGILGLQHILDLNDDRLVVRSSYGLIALHAATGQILWRRELPDMLAAVARNAAGQILCTRQIVQGNKSQLAMLWIDVTTGETKAHSLMPLTSRNPLTLGPIIVSGDRAWCRRDGGIEGDSKPGGNSMRISTMQPTGPAIEGNLP